MYSRLAGLNLFWSVLGGETVNYSVFIGYIPAWIYVSSYDEGCQYLYHFRLRLILLARGSVSRVAHSIPLNFNKGVLYVGVYLFPHFRLRLILFDALHCFAT